MKLLWVKADFLHPTTAGGQIRTLETLKRLHARHEVHYVALTWPGETEGRPAPVSTRAERSPSFTGALQDLARVCAPVGRRCAVAAAAGGLALESSCFAPNGFPTAGA